MATLSKSLDCNAPLSFDRIEEYNKTWDKAKTRWASEFRAKRNGNLVGEIVRWQVADGYAQYMVVSQKPLRLAHINEGDGYAVDPALIRGLRLQDVQAMVDRERSFRKIFSDRSES